MTVRRRDDGPRAAAVVLGALAQIAGSPLGTAVAGRSVGEVSDGNRSLITPAGYAFTIWGVIFAGALAWAVYQALPGERVRPVHRRTGWPLAAAFAGNAVWEVAFPLVGDTAAAVPAVLLFVIVAATALAWARLQALAPEGSARLLPAAVTGLLLGWVTVAAVVQVATAGVVLGAPAEGAAARAWAVVALLAVGAVATGLVLAARVAAGPFALAVVWGLLAVTASGSPAVVAGTALAAAAAVAVALGVQVVRRRTPGVLLVG